MSSNTLGQFFVELGVKGAEGVKSALAGVKKSLEGLSTAFQATAASITALATAGLVGTVEGNRMAFAWQQLAREITAIALPVFEKITAAVQKLTGWLHKLDGDQQRTSLQWGLLAGGAGLLVTGLAPVSGAILAVAGAFDVASEAARAAEISWENAATTLLKKFEWLRLLPGFGGLGKALDLSRQMDAMQGQRPAPHHSVTMAPRGFEAITESYRRIQLATSQIDKPATGGDIKDLGKKLDVANQKLDGVAAAVRGGRPDVARGAGPGA